MTSLIDFKCTVESNLTNATAMPNFTEAPSTSPVQVVEDVATESPILAPTEEASPESSEEDDLDATPAPTSGSSEEATPAASEHDTEEGTPAPTSDST